MNNAQPPPPAHVRLESVEKARSLPEKQGHEENLRFSHQGGTGGSLSDSTHSSREVAENDEDETVAVEHHLSGAAGEDCSSRSTSEDVRKRPSRADQECGRDTRKKQSSSRASSELSDSGDSGNSGSTKSDSEYRGEAATKDSGDNSRDELEGTPENDDSRRQSRTLRREDHQELCEENCDFRKEVSNAVQHRVDQEANTTRPEDRQREQSKSRKRDEVSVTNDAEDDTGKGSFATDGRRRSDSHSSVDGGDGLDKEVHVGEHSDNKHAHESGTVHDELTEQPEIRTLDDDESTINLDDENDDFGQKPSQHGDKGDATGREESDGPANVREHTCSNQDEEREINQCAEIEMSTPSLELTWERPHPRETATSRLHRHISRMGEAQDRLDDYVLPPPKEFLSNHPSGSQSTVRRGQDDPPEAKDSPLQEIAKSATKGRRRSAADLEWSEGEQPREVNNNGDVCCQDEDKHMFVLL